jgi:hypothetical protein
MQWLLVGLVIFLFFVTKTGGAATLGATTPTITSPAPPLNPTGTTKSQSGTAAVAAKAGGITGLLALGYQYLSKIYSGVKTIYSAYSSATSISSAANVASQTAYTTATGVDAADTASGIDAGVNAALAGTTAASLTTTGEIAGTTVSYVTGTASSAVASVVGEAAAGVIGTAALGVGFISLGFVVEQLVNLGLNASYKTGQISKAIMRAEQIAIMQRGEGAIEQAIAAAATFTDAVGVLSRAPAGTSGQVQFGIGTEYAGETLIGRAGTTETPNWQYIVKAMADPATLKDHPEAIANFIANLWVQTGPGGATIFDQQTTFLFRLNLLSKLPNTPDWCQIKTIILNMPVVDPRNTIARDAAIDATPIPPYDTYIRLGWARLDSATVWQWYNIYTSPPSYKRISVEYAAYLLSAIPADQPWNPGTPVQMQPYYDASFSAP